MSGMFSKYLNTGLMINKYWEHSELSWVGLCVEERIDCEMSGEVCGHIDSLYSCTGALPDTEPGLPAANICFFFENLISSQDGRKEGMSHISI